MKIRSIIAVVGLLIAFGSTGAFASNTQYAKGLSGLESTGYTGTQVKINGVNGVNGLKDESNTRAVNGRASSRR